MPRENLVGQTIAGYALQSEVGEGGTSAVFRAQHADHGVVAVKVLREKLRQDRTAVARFLREARYGERVQHPNVVRTIEIGEAGPGMHFLAIEWAAGEILEKYAKQKGPLPLDEVSAIVSQIADAVHAATGTLVVLFVLQVICFQRLPALAVCGVQVKIAVGPVVVFVHVVAV